MSAQRSLPTPTPVYVFFSYAPQDEALRAELETHLSMLEKQGQIRGWNSRRIGPGEDWKNSVDVHIEAARVILLLISADFFASDYCYDVEVARALARGRVGDARVIPILLRDYDWGSVPFAHLPALPSNRKPVTSWPNRDEAWAEVARGIRFAVGELGNKTLAAEQRSTNFSEPLPRYPDAETRLLSERLDAARRRERELAGAGADTAAVRRDILDLRRQLREGGELRAGDSLNDGRYLLLEHVGRGGFASVWRGLDRHMARLVAIKVLHPNLVRDPGRRERFFRGARVMADLKHDAVVRVLDKQGEDGGYHYYLMEFVDGTDLRRAILKREVPEDEIISLILCIGSALAAAHAKGIVHRDVKPANILLDKMRVPRLTDFDLVSVDDTTGGTHTGALGTFVYAAPELMDRPQDATATADVYGLGMTAAFCLYGKELPKTVFGRAASFMGKLPCGAAVKDVLVRAVAWEQSERFADAKAFCEALRDATGLENMSAQQLSNKRHYEGTIVEYQKLVANNPKDIRTFLKIGDLHLKMEQHVEAITTYERVAEFYTSQGFALKTIAVYKQICEIIHKHLPHTEDRFNHIWTRLAEIYAQIGLTSDALAAYDEAVTRVQHAGRDRDAIDILKKVVDLDPQNPLPYLRLADAFIHVKDIENAVTRFGVAVDILLSMGRKEDALKVTERLLQHRPDPWFARVAAEIYLERGELNDAMAALSKLQIAFKDNPKDLNMLALLARAFQKLGQAAKAIEVQKEAARIAKETNQIDVFNALVVALLARAPNDEAVHALAAQRAALSVALRAATVDPRASIDIEVDEDMIDDDLAVPSGAPFALRPSYGAIQVPPPLPTAQRPVVPAAPPDPSARARQLINESERHRARKDYDAALAVLLAAIREIPSFREFREKLCDLLIEAGDEAEAVRQMLAFAHWLEKDGDVEGAARLLDEVLLLEPNQPEALVRLRDFGYAVGP